MQLTSADAATAFFTTVDDAVYVFQVTVTDPEQPDDPATDDVQVTVVNVAPSVDAGPNQTQILGNAVTIRPAFTDVGVEDTHSATVAWGDGTEDAIDLVASPFAAEHTYPDNGTFTVTVTVTDDDEGAGDDTVSVTIDFPSPYHQPQSRAPIRTPMRELRYSSSVLVPLTRTARSFCTNGTSATA